MERQEFDHRLKILLDGHNAMTRRKNVFNDDGNGLFVRYRNPVLTRQHVPVHWQYDLNYETNPHLMIRLGINTVFNPGAIEINGNVYLVARVEGYDRKSFFAVAESENGVDYFRFWDYPVVMPETEKPDVNVYDMRLIRHEDGWIYGIFCTERKDPAAPAQDTSSAVAAAGIARTRDLKNWERLPDLKTPSPQQRNVVLHPEFIDGKYAFYTRPQDGFIETGSGGGIGWGLAETMDGAVIDEEIIVDDRLYHTIKESKNGLGPAPIKTDEGWLHLAHGVRNCAAGLRYVLYAFMTDLNAPWKVIASPGGHFMAPEEMERIGDVSNVLFSSGWVAREDGDLLIYYASSDTRCHVARTTVEKMVDYVIHTPKDALKTAACVKQRCDLIDSNRKFLQK